LKQVDKPGKFFILPKLNTPLLRGAAAKKRTPHQGLLLPIFVNAFVKKYRANATLIYE
jgi:hypothetical protein